MFKKIIISTVLAITPVLFSFAYAIQFTAISETQFDQSSNSTAFWRLTITADEDDEMLPEHGLNFVLPTGEAIQWDRYKNGALQLSGSAAHKVDPVPVISEDLYVLHLKLNEPIAKGEEIYIEGLTPRTFKRSLSTRHLGLDINGDQIQDLTNFHSYLVKSVAKTDFIAPYDPEDFQANYDPAQKVVNLSWKNAPEFDFWQSVVTRERMVDGKKQKIDVYSGNDSGFTDKNVINGDVTYTIYAVDETGNNSGSVQAIINIGGAPAPIDEPPAPVINDGLDDIQVIDLTL